MKTLQELQLREARDLAIECSVRLGGLISDCFQGDVGRPKQLELLAPQLEVFTALMNEICDLLGERPPPSEFMAVTRVRVPFDASLTAADHCRAIQQRLGDIVFLSAEHNQEIRTLASRADAALQQFLEIVSEPCG